MKVSDILESQRIDEAPPMGIMSRLGRTLQSKLPGGYGVSGQAHLDVGIRANQLEKTFRKWAIGSGVNLANVPFNDLEQFLQQQQIPFPNQLKQQSYNLSDPEDNKNFWTALSQNSYRQAGLPVSPLGQSYGTSSLAAPSSPTPPTTSSTTSPEDQIKSLWGSLGANEKNALRLWLQANP